MRRSFSTGTIAVLFTRLFHSASISLLKSTASCCAFLSLVHRLAQYFVSQALSSKFQLFCIHEAFMYAKQLKFDEGKFFPYLLTFVFANDFAHGFIGLYM